MRRNVVALSVAVLVLAALPVQAGNDDAGVRGLIPKFKQAWANADAQGLAQLFASEADLVIPTGHLFSGRQAIGSFYASVFSAGYKGSVGTGQVERLRFVAPDVALGDGTWSITGAHDPSGREAPPERGIFTFVAVREKGQWKISGLREQTSATTLNIQK